MRRTWLVWGAILLWLAGAYPASASVAPCCLPAASSATAPHRMPCCPLRATISPVRGYCLGAVSAASVPTAAKPLLPASPLAPVSAALPRVWPPVPTVCRVPAAAAVPFPPPRGPGRPRAPPVLS